MAGIGFELKKLYRKKGLFNNSKAILYSIAVTIGPTVICMATLLFFNILLKNAKVNIGGQNIIQATIMYSFIFSLILTSGYSMVISRYISDKLYEKKYQDIKASLYGAILIIVSIGSIIGILFYFKSPLDITYKVLSYILFIELIIEIILSVYVTALENLKVITAAFFIGFLCTAIISSLMITYTNINPLIILIASFDVGLLLLILILYYEIQKYFKIDNKNYFEFLGWFKKHYLLFAINTFYTLAIYIHNFVFWMVSDMNYVVGETFIYCPSYDVPAFYALVSTLPTMIMFVVKFETSFFDKFKVYFYFVNNGASYKDIEVAREEMKEVLFREITYIMMFQLIITVVAIFIGDNIFMRMGFTSQMIDEFNILALGYYCMMMIFVITNVLLYFDDRKGAFVLNGIFLVTNMLFTIETTILGERYFGMGIFISAIIVMCLGLLRLKHFTNNIEYYVFCKNVRWSK